MDTYLKFGRWLAIALMLVIALRVIDYWIKVNTAASKNSCFANLKQIEGAKATWALENGKTNLNEIPGDSDLFGTSLYIREKPSCPHSGMYTIGNIGEHVRCSIPMHSLEAGDIHIRDDADNPIAGVSVSANGEGRPGTCVITDTNGFGHVDCWTKGATAVLISKAGYKASEISLTNHWPFRITLKKSPR
jgi:hypothetical protein